MKKKVIILTSIIAAAIIIYVVAYFADVYKIINKTKTASVDWPYYNTVEDLVDKVDYIYEGTVTGIHYEVLDLRTGYQFVKKSEEDIHFGMLYTIYEIEVKERYKGEPPTKTAIKIEGGIRDENELEQGILLKNAGLHERQVDSKVMNIGETYLFTTFSRATKNQFIPNPDQFKYSENNSNIGSGVNYDTIKKYVTSPEYANPEEVSTTYMDTDSKLLSTPEEIVTASDNVFEGIVYDIDFLLKDSQLITRYKVYISNRYKGKEKSSMNYDYVFVDGGTDDYEVKEQYRILNKNKLTARTVFRELTTLEKGKKYVFAVSNGTQLNYSTVKNPAQFAFCSDNSNAPGGVDYRMMKEYLKK